MKYEKPVALTKDRLADALNIRQMKPIELSEKTGIPISSISHYTSGMVEPKQNRIYLIAHALNISEAWLIGYDVPMEKTNSYTYSLNDAEKELIELYRNVSTEKQSMILEMIKVATNN